MGRGGVIVAVSVGAKGQWSRNENCCGVVPLNLVVFAMWDLWRRLSAESRWESGGLHLQFCASGCEQLPVNWASTI